MNLVVYGSAAYRVLDYPLEPIGAVGADALGEATSIVSALMS